MSITSSIASSIISSVASSIICSIASFIISSSANSIGSFWGGGRGVGVESGGDLCVVRVNKCNIVYVYH